MGEVNLFNIMSLMRSEKTMQKLIPLIILSLPSIALAQLPVDPNAKFELGLNVGYTADAYQADNTLSVLPHAFYDNNRLYFEGGEAGIYAYKDNKHHLRAGLAYDGRSFEPSDADSLALQHLDKRKASVVAQANYMYITPVGGIRAKLAKNIGTDGMAVSLAHISRFEHNKATIYPSFGITWHDKAYNRYYYGISESESAKSGLSSYAPDASVSPFASLTVMYDLTDKIGLMGNQRLEWLSNEQKNSPMVDGKLNSTTRIGLSYKF